MSGKIKMDPTKELCGYLVRHGELRISEDKWDGWGPYRLSEKGRESAEKAGQWLSMDRIGRIVSSDLPRALETAEIIQSCVNCACPQITTEPGIRAMAIGDFTGKDKTDERKKLFKWYRNHPDIPIPGGQSVNDHKAQVKVAFQYLATPYCALPTVIVTHNSVLKSLMGIDMRGDVVFPGGIIGVFMTESGGFEFDILLGEADGAPEEWGLS